MGETQVFNSDIFIGIHPIFFKKNIYFFLGNFMATFPSLQCGPAGFYLAFTYCYLKRVLKTFCQWKILVSESQFNQVLIKTIV
ncbi:hypothetical protein Hanom_Chr04g00316681 [Helianthus anomalus]